MNFYSRVNACRRFADVGINRAKVTVVLVAMKPLPIYINFFVAVHFFANVVGNDGR